jgi:hypothetical protein
MGGRKHRWSNALMAALMGGLGGYGLGNFGGDQLMKYIQDRAGSVNTAGARLKANLREQQGKAPLSFWDNQEEPAGVSPAGTPPAGAPKPIVPPAPPKATTASGRMAQGVAQGGQAVGNAMKSVGQLPHQAIEYGKSLLPAGIRGLL